MSSTDSTSYGAGICGVTMPCGRVDCYDLCHANRNSISYCKSTCGLSDTAGTGCGTAEALRNVCFHICAALGNSGSICASTCGS